MGLFKNELVKLFKTKYLYVFSALLILLTALIAYDQKTQMTGWQSVIKTFNAQSLPLAFVNTTAQFMAVFIGIYAAWSIADEYKKGAFKLPLLKPVSRIELLHAKILALLVFNLVIILVNILASYAIGLEVFGWGEAAVYKDVVLAPAAGILITFLAYGLNLLPYMAFGMLTLFIALQAESMTTTIMAAIGISYLGQFFYLIQPIRIYSIVTQMYYFSDYLILGEDSARAILSLVTNLAYFLVFYLLARKTIQTKDLIY